MTPAQQAYYQPLINAWNTSHAAAVSSTVTGVAGVTGQSLNGLSTDAAIAAVNLWTMPGQIPASIDVTGTQLWNCVNWTELAFLTDAQRKDVIGMCQIPGGLRGGTANTAFATVGMIIAYFIYANSCTGSISGTTLTVTVASTRPLLPGATLSGNSVAAGTTVLSGPAAGGTGSYVVSISQTVSSGSITIGGPTIAALTALSTVQTPLWWNVLAANGGGGLNGPVSTADTTIAGLS
jgi:hypothetical protein